MGEATVVFVIVVVVVAERVDHGLVQLLEDRARHDPDVEVARLRIQHHQYACASGPTRRYPAG